MKLGMTGMTVFGAIALALAVQATGASEPVPSSIAGTHEARPAAQEIRCTTEHPFWVQGRGWVAAQDLQPGDELVSSTGESLVVVAQDVRQEEADHYNFEVEDFHTYFVSETEVDPAVWVHNACFDPDLGGFKKGISADELRDLNRQMGGQSELTGVAETALANAARQEGFWMKAGSLVRDISGRHLFNDANKRTALAVVNELAKRNNVLSGVSQAKMRRVINDVATRKLTEVRDIARALRGD